MRHIMTNENTKFNDYLTKLQNINLPKFADLPQFDLYMDQVIGLVNQYIAPLGIDSITSSMINNYVKHKVIHAPIKKKYTRYQLANILIIAIAKNVFTLDEIQKGIYDLLATDDAATAYDAFITTFLDTLHGVNSNLEEQIITQQINIKNNNTVMISLACNSIVQKLLVEQLINE